MTIHESFHRRNKFVHFTSLKGLLSRLCYKCCSDSEGQRKRVLGNKWVIWPSREPGRKQQASVTQHKLLSATQREAMGMIQLKTVAWHNRFSTASLKSQHACCSRRLVLTQLQNLYSILIRKVDNKLRFTFTILRVQKGIFDLVLSTYVVLHTQSYLLLKPVTMFCTLLRRGINHTPVSLQQY